MRSVVGASVIMRSMFSTTIYQVVYLFLPNLPFRSLAHTVLDYHIPQEYLYQIEQANDQRFSYIQ